METPLTHFQQYLKRLPFLTEADCRLFEPHLREQTVAKPRYFLQPGEICHYLGFVSQGLFRVFYLAGDKEVNTRFVLEEDFVGDYDSFLQRKPSRYYIQALEPAVVVAFSLPALEEAYRQSHHWERFGRLVAEQAYQETTQRMESFLFMDAETRYLQLMETRPAYLDRIPLYHLASYLGIERESLSRIRRQLARRGRL